MSITSHLPQLLVALIVIFTLMAGLSWFARHLLQRRNGSDKHQQLTLLSSLTIGSKEKILLIEIDRHRLVLGVTPNQISTLLDYSDEPSETADQADSPEINLAVSEGMRRL